MAKYKARYSYYAYLKRAINAVIHPSSNKQELDISESFKFYYRAAIIPLVAALVAGAMLYLSQVNALNSLYAAPASLYNIIGRPYVIAWPLTDILLLVPLSIIINSAIYHFFSKMLFKIWKGPYKNTLAASMYGSLPHILFLWVLALPLGRRLSVLLALPFSLWGLIVLTISMARQHNIDAWRAFAGILLPIVVIVIIAVASALLLLTALPHF